MWIKRLFTTPKSANDNDKLRALAKDIEAHQEKTKGHFKELLDKIMERDETIAHHETQAKTHQGLRYTLGAAAIFLLGCFAMYQLQRPVTYADGTRPRVTIEKDVLTKQDIQEMASKLQESIAKVDGKLDKTTGELSSKIAAVDAKVVDKPKTEPPVAESKVEKTSDKLPADKPADEQPAAKTEAPVAKVEPPAPKPDVLWEGDLQSKTVVAGGIIEQKCGAGVDIPDLERTIKDAVSSDDFRTKLVCPAAAPTPAEPTGPPVRTVTTAPAQEDCRKLPGTVYMPQFAACVPVLRGR